MLGPPPLLPEEDADAYEGILRQLSLSLVPVDIIEWLDLKEIGDLSWEVIRYRRLRRTYLAGRQRDAINAFLINRQEPKGIRREALFASRDKLMSAWARREPKAVERIEAILRQYGRTSEDFNAETLLGRLGEIERLEALITAAYARRNEALREFERRRDPRAGRLRRVSDEIIEASANEPAPSPGRVSNPRDDERRHERLHMDRRAAVNAHYDRIQRGEIDGDDLPDDVDPESELGTCDGSDGGGAPDAQNEPTPQPERLEGGGHQQAARPHTDPAGGDSGAGEEGASPERPGTAAREAVAPQVPPA
ncbi:hypothetical protein [Salinarimonas soli]|uniref:hypothetical protein n=1 Tax=Salinarimonas soli TaxID=1638099 RepID=UPI001AEF2014|nr:hypothetical protein [Salinarimonas soli]